MRVKEAVEWALECMRHYSECDISEEDRENIVDAKEVILFLEVENLRLNGLLDKINACCEYMNIINGRCISCEKRRN